MVSQGVQMPVKISATGIWIDFYHQWSSGKNGFTLIELLVVVFIIGIISGVAVLSVGGVEGGRRLETEAQRMGHLFSLATQEAILQGRPVGVTLKGAEYGFVMAGKEEWEELEGEPLLANRTLPGDWQLELIAGGYQKLQL